MRDSLLWLASHPGVLLASCGSVLIFYFVYVAASGLSCSSKIFVAVHGLLLVAHRLSCPTAHGILVPQPGIESMPLHWKVDS